MQALLAEGADVEAKDNGGRTALVWAAEGGHTDIVQALLAKGLEIWPLSAHYWVNTTDSEGWTALMHAASKGHSESAAPRRRSGARHLFWISGSSAKA